MTFSIIIPTYNRATLLLDTVQSALSQNYDRNGFEVIVVDDGSTDNTKELIEAIHDDRLRYIWKENEERGAARNFGATQAKGEYLYFLDSDDILYANHLAVAKEFIVAQNSPPWFFQFYEIKEGGHTKQVQVNLSNPKKQLMTKGNFLSCHGVFLRNELFKTLKFVEDRDLAGSEDYELWIRWSMNHPLYINPVCTSALIIHDNRSVFNFSPEKLVKRKMKLIEIVSGNNSFTLIEPSFKKGFLSNSFSYIALHLSMLGKAKLQTIWFHLKSIYFAPTTILSKRSMVILKNLVFKWG